MASCDAAAAASAAAAMQKLMHIAADAAKERGVRGGRSCGKAQNPKRWLLHCQTQRTQQERHEQAWHGQSERREEEQLQGEGGADAGSRTKQTMWLQISSKPPTTSSVSPGLGIGRGGGGDLHLSLHLGAKNMHPPPPTWLVNKSLSQAVGVGECGLPGRMPSTGAISLSLSLCLSLSLLSLMKGHRVQS